jgi:glutamate synthase domain-containing protein 2
VAGNDVVFQLGTGKFGVGKIVELSGGRTMRALDEAALVELVRSNTNIRMIQIKLSQGAKPGLGGHLPGDKVTPEIAAVRRVAVGQPLVSPAQHAELQAPDSQQSVARLMEFCAHIRKLTELPVSIKMCVGRLDELDLLTRAMQATGEGPDHIQLDGADGGTGAAPNLFLNYVGYGMVTETLGLLHEKLVALGIRDSVKLSVSGKMLTPVHAALAYALGADWVDAARSLMLAIGCIQSLKCHTNHCPTGIATNSAWRTRGLSVPEKSTRVHNFLTGFNADMLELCRVLGHTSPCDITLADLRESNLPGVS